MTTKFDHLVVLMMENRSFDHMLGRLYHHNNPDPYHIVPRHQSFDGVADTMFNTITFIDQPGQVGNVLAHRTTDFATPAHHGPAHDFKNVQLQINGLLPPSTHTDGFVIDRIKDLKSKNITASQSQMADVMAGFSPTKHTVDGNGSFANARVLSTLAHKFAVCDNWHASIPGPTFPNRSFLHAATSNGFVSNGPTLKWSLHFAPTIFNRMAGKGLSAKIYHGGSGPALFKIKGVKSPHLPALVYELHPVINPTRFPRASFDDFKSDCASGTLPHYSFIEPEIIGSDADWAPNDQHPVRDIRFGEDLMQQTYQAVSTGKNWERTLLVIIYDEHGGFFDHRYPPAALPPSFGAGEDGFTFTQLGVRVPAVLVSPFIEEGTIFHPSRLVDHTSVIRTLCARFGLEPLTPRDASACDLSGVFGKHLRSDVPVIAPVDIPPEAMQADLPLNDLQLDYLNLVATNRGIRLPPLELESHARSFLESVSPTPPIRSAG